MLFVAGGEGTDFRLLAVCGDEELVVIEKPLVAFAFVAALLAVAEHLVDGFGDRLFDFRRFAFDDGDGQAV